LRTLIFISDFSCYHCCCCLPCIYLSWVLQLGLGFIQRISLLYNNSNTDGQTSAIALPVFLIDDDALFKSTYILLYFTPTLSFLQAGCPSCRPANRIKALSCINES